jgi:mRNA interferase MazF
MADLDPTRGHEQAGRRPVLVISDDLFNVSAAGLAIVLPLTSKNKHIPFHVEVSTGEGGLSRVSYIKCEDIRSVAKERLQSRLDSVTETTLAEVRYRLRLLLQL